MMKVNFVNDYSQVAHEKVLARLAEAGREANSGYGTDRYTRSAAEKIKAACGKPDADVFLLTGGTQTNQVVIASLLKPYQGVVTVDSGHIAVHEGGAIETTGHKVLTLPPHDGRLDADELADYLKLFYAGESYDHMVIPGMVYISYPTEYGTLYSRSELERIYAVCREYRMPLFIDGARLGYGLCSPACDITMKDLAELCDVFYIGGTKVGAMNGEAVVFCNIPMPEYFVTMAKQRGALLAKGFVLGLQFDTLFTDNLYLQISRNAIDTAEEIKKILKEKGYRFLLDSPTNQIFIIVKDEELPKLSEGIGFECWEKVDAAHTAIRLVTSWATSREDVEQIKALLPDQRQI